MVSSAQPGCAELFSTPGAGTCRRPFVAARAPIRPRASGFCAPDPAVNPLL